MDGVSTGCEFVCDFFAWYSFKSMSTRNSWSHLFQTEGTFGAIGFRQLEPLVPTVGAICFRPRALAGARDAGSGDKPSTLNPQPSTLNPQPSTLNPQPSTLNPQSSTLNHKPQILNPKP